MLVVKHGENQSEKGERAKYERNGRKSTDRQDGIIEAQERHSLSAELMRKNGIRTKGS